MISKLALEERVREWGLREDVVEKDYVIGWVLWGIGTEPSLLSAWAFKGGTCLKKCYIETYRFSEDLDFTVLPDGPIAPDDLRPLLVSLLDRVGQASGIDFTERPPLLKGHVSGNYYRGPHLLPRAARGPNGNEHQAGPQRLRAGCAANRAAADRARLPGHVA